MSNDPLSLGLPSVDRTTGIDWVAENIGGTAIVIPLGVLEPGQDIAFVCKASVTVIGNTSGGLAKLGDPWDFINGAGDPAASSCRLLEFVEQIHADGFEDPDTG